MKISKSFKIYIHIFAIFFFAQQLLSDVSYSKNIVVHKEPNLTFGHYSEETSIKQPIGNAPVFLVGGIANGILN